LFVFFLTLVGALVCSRDSACIRKWATLVVAFVISLIWGAEHAECAPPITQGVPHQPESSSGGSRSSESSLRSTARTLPGLNVPVRSPSVEAPAGPRFGLESAAELLVLLQDNLNRIQTRVGVLSPRYGWTNDPAVHKAAAIHVYRSIELYDDSDILAQRDLYAKLRQNPGYLDQLIKDYMNG